MELALLSTGSRTSRKTGPAIRHLYREVWSDENLVPMVK